MIDRINQCRLEFYLESSIFVSAKLGADELKLWPIDCTHDLQEINNHFHSKSIPHNDMLLLALVLAQIDSCEFKLPKWTVEKLEVQYKFFSDNLNNLLEFEREKM